ncbi:hypothetical protein PIB30_017617 [Stylosanthes scabra]|uniref:Ubiquitin-like protease family profile domain-containing protein n=1 Tax=Stylosanthes scabra TaxID=79078 RepID=A0ABU6V7K8_9FABA|nr:hypothetical protein [Stylosanthes scabra]
MGHNDPGENNKSRSNQDDEGASHQPRETRSETLVRVERKSKRRNDSVPAPVPVLRSHDSDSDDHQTVAQALLSRKRKNVEGHGSRSKRTRNPIDSPIHNKEDDASNAESGNLFLDGHEELHQQPHNQPSEEEETQPQPQQPPQEESPNQDLVSSPRDMLLTDTLLRMRNDEQPNKPEDENGPALNEVDEKQQQQQQQQKEEHPSQSIVEVVPIATTQEVIDISSNSDDDKEPQPRPIKMMVPKVEECLVSSPASMLITDVLMSMGEDTAIEPQPEEESQPDPSMPSFSLNLDNPMPQGPQVLKAMRFQFDSMAPKSYIDIQIVGLMCHVLNGEEGERYEKLVYCIPPEIIQRMLETHHHNWINKKKRRPHEITSLTNHKEYLSYIDREKLISHRFLFSPVLYSEHWWLYVLDKNEPKGPEMFILDSKNISSPTDERTTLNKFASNILNQLLRWAGAPTVLKKGSWSLLPTYINVPQQPNDYDCAVFVMKWMELIDPTKLHGCCTYNIEQWTDIKDRGEDNPEQGKYNESRCNKGGTRNAMNKAIFCSS